MNHGGTMRLRFIGLGHMGEPMATRLLDNRPDLVICP